MYVCGVQRLLGPLELELHTDSCELSDVSVGNWIQVLYKSGKHSYHSYLLTYLSSPCIYILILDSTP